MVLGAVSAGAGAGGAADDGVGGGALAGAVGAGEDAAGGGTLAGAAGALGTEGIVS